MQKGKTHTFLNANRCTEGERKLGNPLYTQTNFLSKLELKKLL